MLLALLKRKYIDMETRVTLNVLQVFMFFEVGGELCVFSNDTGTSSHLVKVILIMQIYSICIHELFFGFCFKLNDSSVQF